tara:strand:- start:32 stop:331 length:300 start_codon:yes stop_codon:yes gene_type:complete
MLPFYPAIYFPSSVAGKYIPGYMGGEVSMTWNEWIKIAIGARAVRLRSGQGRGVAGVSAPALSRYERGSRRPAQEVTVRAWARGLELDEEQAVAAWRAA